MSVLRGALDVGDLRRRCAVDLHEHVPRLEARAIGRRAHRDRGDLTERRAAVRRDVADGDAEARRRRDLLRRDGRGRLLAAGAQRDGGSILLSAAHDLEGHRRADVAREHLAEKILRPAERLAADGRDDVARLEVRLRGGPPGDDLAHERADARRHLHLVRQRGRDVLDAHPDERPLDLPLREELRGDAAREARRHREAEAAAAPDDHRVDAEHLAVEVRERPAGVARVDPRVGLQVILDRVHAEAPATLGADDAGRDGRAEAERRADRDDPLADLRRVAVAEARRHEVFRGDAEHREIGRRIAPDELRREEATVREPHVDRQRVLDDVVVRQDSAVRREDDARAHPALDGDARIEPAEPRKHRRLLVARRDVDLHDARPDLLGDRAERLAELSNVGGRGHGGGLVGEREGRERRDGEDDGEAAEHRAMLPDA